MPYDRGSDWPLIRKIARRHHEASSPRGIERLLKIRGGGRSQAVASALAPPAPQNDPVERVRRRRLERLERQRVGIRDVARRRSWRARVASRTAAG